MPSYENQGERTSQVFAGRGPSQASRRIYGESAELFAGLIAQHLPHGERPYVFADIGGFKGELMDEVLSRLPRHVFNTIAIDINRAALAENRAQHKIAADVVDTRLHDNAVDVAICRYVLQWNPPDKQRRILRELNRITRRVVILQHFGCDGAEPEHRVRIDAVLSGVSVPKLRREDYYFSTAEEVEAWSEASGGTFERRAHVQVHNLSDSFVERYALASDEARRIKDILGEYDYIVLTTWVISPNGLEG